MDKARALSRRTNQSYKGSSKALSQNQCEDQAVPFLAAKDSQRLSKGVILIDSGIQDWHSVLLSYWAVPVFYFLLTF